MMAVAVLPACGGVGNAMTTKRFTVIIMSIFVSPHFRPIGQEHLPSTRFELSVMALLPASRRYLDDLA